jgi:hypothetical protein
LYEIDQEIQVLFVLNSLTDNHFIDVSVLQEQSDLIASDGLCDGLFADKALCITPADDDDVLSDPIDGFEHDLVQLENQQKIHKERNRENRRRESPPPASKNIDERHTQQRAQTHGAEYPLEQIPRRLERAFVNAEDQRRSNVDYTEKSGSSLIRREIVFGKGHPVPGQKGQEKADVQHNGIEYD